MALKRCLTWVNRLLFLWLLEGQLRRYHAGNFDELTHAQGGAQQRKVFHRAQ